MTDLRFSGINERDIDFLLMEEFTTSPNFLAWFLARANVLGDNTLTSVAHSVSTANGETDIELRLESAAGVKYILVENKIGAPLQPRQAERYHERAKRYKDGILCLECLSVLVAPASYVGDDAEKLGFDFTVTYEDIVKWYTDNATPQYPYSFKLAILRRALEKGGYAAIPNEATTQFWKRYWEIATSMAPELGMSEPGDKPELSGFISFQPKAFPKGVKLIHKVRYGNVDIQFAGKAEDVDALKILYGALPVQKMNIKPAGKSAVVRLEVPRIDMSAPFLDSESAVREAIWAAKLLLVWYTERHGKP
jgi:hypothetical protein